MENKGNKIYCLKSYYVFQDMTPTKKKKNALYNMEQEYMFLIP